MGAKPVPVFARILVAVCLFVALVWVTLQGFLPQHVYLFPGVAGPEGITTMAEPDSHALLRYSVGSPSRLAILLTDPEASWLGLAHGLKSIGVPFIITDDYQRALQHKVIFVYPLISGRVLSAEALQAIARFPQSGGTLIGQNVLGGELYDVFGFATAVPSTTNTALHLTSDHPATRQWTEVEERVLRLGMHDDKAHVKGTYAYTAPQYPPLAVYEDGTAAITQKPYATGRAYAFGIDVGYLLLKGHNARHEGMVGATYANGFEPTLDVVLRLMQHLYVEGDPTAVTLGTTPFGKALVVIVTHDIDYTLSMKNAVAYAEVERGYGFAGTYFIQTKYVRDWNDDIFFNPAGVAYLKQLQKLGMELGSHSVSHSETFSRFPPGQGDERYPAYRPFVKEQFVTFNGTVLGELRVSRFLLEHFLPGQRIVSFRPGHLQYPFSLPEALAATGYRFSSTITANTALTHLPFQLNHLRGHQAEVEVYEFPITVEDELTPPLLERLPQALKLARKLSRYGGLFVLLIHPDVVGQKLEFERRFIEAVRDDAWLGSLEEFGTWWAARDVIELDSSVQGHRQTVHVKAPIPLAGLTITVPEGLVLTGHQPSEVRVIQSGTRVTIEHLAYQVHLVFERQGPTADR
jgi:hypothetical protein